MVGLLLVNGGIGNAEAPLKFAHIADWLVKEGKDGLDFANTSAADLLGLPLEGVHTKTQGVIGRDAQPASTRLCKLVQKDSKPESLVLVSIKDYPVKAKAKFYTYRFMTDDSLLRAFSAVAKLQGEALVPESAEEIALKIDDPEIQERAQAELDFWLKHVEKLAAKKKPARRPSPPKKKP